MRASALDAQESVLELNARVHALDARPSNLCLDLFDGAPLRSTKTAIKAHTLLELDLRAAIPGFIHISNGKLHDPPHSAASWRGNHINEDPRRTA